jgi:hypothetical protein
MVIEAFYGHNTVFVVRSHLHLIIEDINVIRYPPALVAPFVRHLRVHPPIVPKTKDLGMQKMAFLAKIADGTLGFKNLHTLFIAMHAIFSKDTDQKDLLDALQSAAPMRLPTRQLRSECARIEYRHREHAPEPGRGHSAVAHEIRPRGRKLCARALDSFLRVQES